MITEDQLEQLAIQWFQDTGWNSVHGVVIAPEGVAAEREALRTLTPALSHGEKEEDGRLAEAVRLMCRPFRARNLVDDVTQGAALIFIRKSAPGAGVVRRDENFLRISCTC